MSRRSKLCACILASCLPGTLMVASDTGASASAARAHAAVACHLSPSDYQHLGPSYLTSLNVHGTSCSTGKRVVQAYYSCRVHSGGVRGTCHHSVLGYHCSQHITTQSSVQFDASVSCVNGSRRVNHTYAQNT